MKTIICTPIGNRIRYVNLKPDTDHSDNSHVVGKPEDHTDAAIRAVFDWFRHEADKKGTGYYDISYEGEQWVLSIRRIEKEPEAVTDE